MQASAVIGFFVLVLVLGVAGSLGWNAAWAAPLLGLLAVGVRPLLGIDGHTHASPDPLR